MNEADGTTFHVNAFSKQVERDVVCEFTESAGLVAPLGNQLVARCTLAYCAMDQPHFRQTVAEWSLAL